MLQSVTPGISGPEVTVVLLCTGNKTKPEVGDAATCDQVCEPQSSRPNDQRTSCGEYGVSSHRSNHICDFLGVNQVGEFTPAIVQIIAITYRLINGF